MPKKNSAPGCEPKSAERRRDQEIIDARGSIIAELKAQVADLQGQVAGLGAQLNTVGERIHEARSEARTLRTTLEATRMELATLAQEKLWKEPGTEDDVSPAEMKRRVYAVQTRIEELVSKCKAHEATADRVPALETTIRTLAEMLPRGPVVKEWRIGIDWSRPEEPKPKGFPDLKEFSPK